MNVPRKAWQRLLAPPALAAVALLCAPVAEVSAEPAARPGDAAHGPVSQLPQAPEVDVAGSSVRVANPTDRHLTVEIYALTGQRVQQLSLQPGQEATVDLSRGYYIVRAGTGHSRRIAIP